MTRTFRSSLRVCLSLLFLAPLAPPAALAEVLVVANANGGTGDLGVLLLLDTATGRRTLLSDFGDPAQGPLGLDMRRVAALPDGDLVVVDPWFGQLFRVDGTTGQRTSIGRLDDPRLGPTVAYGFGVAAGGSGQVLLTDPDGARLFLVDLGSGQRSVLSDFSDPAQGPGQLPLDPTLDGAGRILVSDAAAGTGGAGAIVVVDGASGERTLLSDFGDPAQGDVADISSVVADPTAGILAISGQAKRIYRIHPATGARSRIADFTDATHGTTFDFQPETLAVDQRGLLQVVGSTVLFPGYDLVIQVDPANGLRELQSELYVPEQGTTGFNVKGIAHRHQHGVFADGFESGDLGQWSLVIGF
jgi:hypothetical protein